MQYNNKAKLKEQNSSRLTDSKKGLVVTKGEECGRAGPEEGRRGLWGIILVHMVWGVTGKQCSTEKANNESVASYYPDGQ